MSSPATLPELTPEQEAESNLARILGVSATFHILALIFVGVRMYTRFVIIKAPKLDDAFMLLATFRRYSWVYSLTAPIIAYSILKISIALSLIRLSRSKWYSWTLWGVIGFIISYTIVAMCSFFFHCRPMAGSWNRTIPGAQCYPQDLFVAFSLMNTAFNMTTDVICATLPIPIIYNLNMKLRTRIYLIVIMSLGWVTVGMGVVKAIYQIALPITPDAQFEYSIQFWGFLQFNLGIIVACCPTLRPLLGKALKLSSRDKYYGDYYGSKSRGLGAGAGGVMSGPMRSNRPSQHPGTLNEEDGFEMMDTPSDYDRKKTIQTTVQGGHAMTIYDKGERSGSEEMILQDTNGKGILRTTEIEVR
ncbi:hypothetical protein S40285_05386 [Stachybotrys chlorohalonatus IBT 40285]|uniref:Rhodopsin domain-containing protein n=1 Tax=Stachybotrys chlorohalonatus (strain IBT 40285) TaxID=1283841 RepID=A0A084QX07_STAC4|nr:hypothetical protein S40285_05386 [Stachybotrys chlorohalonata IBT 40285]